MAQWKGCENIPAPDVILRNPDSSLCFYNTGKRKSGEEQKVSDKAGARKQRAKTGRQRRSERSGG